MVFNKIFDFLTMFKKTILLVVLSLGCFIIFWRFILFKNLYIYYDIGSDTFNSYWPFINNLYLSIRDGVIPFWSPNIGIGQNYYASETFIGDIFVYLYLFLDHKYLVYAFGFMAVLKIILSASFFYRFITYLNVSFYASLIGAILYGFNGYLILWGQHYQFANIIVYTPLLLYGYERLLKENKWGVYVSSIFLIAIYSYYFLYVISIFFLLYALVRYLITNQFKLTNLLKFALKSVLYYLLGLSLASVLLIPTIYYVLHSPRISGSAHIPLFQLNDINYYVSLVFRLLSNNSLGIGNNFYGAINYYEVPILYSSIFSLIIIPQFFLHLSKKEKILYSILYVLLISFTIFPYFSSMFNAFSAVNYRWTFVIVIYNVFIATISLNSIQKYKYVTNIKIFFVSLFIIILVPMISLYYAGNKLKWTAQNMSSSLFVIIKCLVLCLVYILILRLMKHYNIRILKILLLVIIFSEIILNSYHSVNSRDILQPKYITNKEGYYDNTNEAVNFIKKTDGSFFRINKDYNSKFLNDSLMQNYKGFNSYNSLNNTSYINFLNELNVPIEGSMALISGLDKRPIIETLLSNKYLLSKNDPVPYGYEYKGKFKDVNLFQNKNFLPLGFSYNSFIKYEDFKNLTQEQKDQVLLKAFVKSSDDKALDSYTQITSKDLKVSPIEINLDKTIKTVANIEIKKNSFPNELEFKSLNNDPNFTISALDDISGEISLSFIAKSVGESIGQVFWKTKSNQFNETNSLKFNLLDGEKDYTIKLGNLATVESIRLDLSNVAGDYILKNFKLSLINFKYNEVDINNLKKDTLNMIDYNNNFFKGDIHLDSSKLLFFSIPYDKGWTLKVDNKPTNIEKVNISFIGISLEKGYHTIELSYTPPYFWIGVLISIISIILVILLIFLKRIRKLIFKI